MVSSPRGEIKAMLADIVPPFLFIPFKPHKLSITTIPNKYKWGGITKTAFIG
jgi:hypothetical protein